ncbi:hypothetical protein HG536_0F02380 [Torulaspora globosa]|uniref:SH3 domain-containing protein n=1 Tax=Torulaspora globosa TaxID=48254 RepID=A0A7G3ZK77_9SACH|nr:uncharacterized protein HG536_0F02380 [Torulaspora globosa]QLL33913.1 hypothetical protein HG536_0F02380 [Torulaspora globosa]
MAGAGAGGMVGVELTDFVFILNSAAAVKSFSEFGTVTLGGNISVSAGPLGRNAEAAASASAGGVSSVFAYSKSKGLFAGVSVEGSVIVERREANRKFYGDSCTAKMILSGRIRPPPAADPLFRVLESRAFNYRSAMPADDYDDYYDDIPDSFDSSDVSSTRPTTKSTRQRRSGSRSYFDDDDFDDDHDSDGNGYSGRRGSRGRESYDDDFSDPSGANEYYRSYRRQGARSPRHTNTRWEDDVFDRDNDVDDLSNRFSKSRISSSAAGNARVSRPVSEKPDFGSLSSSNTPKAVALYSFAGEESGDLPFRKGDVITILKKSESQDDWWTGRVNGREGIFPANYVELV